MRWITSRYPRCGDYRVRQGFLWFPKTIGIETRWLERAKWKEQYVCTNIQKVWRAFEWLPVGDEYEH